MSPCDRYDIMCYIRIRLLLYALRSNREPEQLHSLATISYHVYVQFYQSIPNFRLARQSHRTRQGRYQH